MFARPFSLNYRHSKSKISLKFIKQHKQQRQPTQSCLNIHSNQQQKMPKSYLVHSIHQINKKTSYRLHAFEKSCPVYVQIKKSLIKNKNKDGQYVKRSIPKQNIFTTIKTKSLINNSKSCNLLKSQSEIYSKVQSQTNKKSLFCRNKQGWVYQRNEQTKPKSILISKKMCSESNVKHCQPERIVNGKKLIKKNILQCYQELKIKYNELKTEYDSMKSMQQLVCNRMIDNQVSSQTNQSTNPESKQFILAHAQANEDKSKFKKHYTNEYQIYQKPSSQTSIQLDKSQTTKKALNAHLQFQNSNIKNKQLMEAHKIEEIVYYKNQCLNLEKELEFAYTTVLELKKEIQKINLNQTEQIYLQRSHKNNNKIPQKIGKYQNQIKQKCITSNEEINQLSSILSQNLQLSLNKYSKLKQKVKVIVSPQQEYSGEYKHNTKLQSETINAIKASESVDGSLSQRQKDIVGDFKAVNC